MRFLPDHNAATFELEGLMRAISPQTLRYARHFMSIVRRSPETSRGAALFKQCLVDAHSDM